MEPKIARLIARPSREEPGGRPTDLFPVAPLLPPLPRLVPEEAPTPFDPNAEHDDA